MKTLLGSLVVVCLGLSGCSPDQKKAEASTNKAPEPIAVQTQAAQLRQVDKTLSVTGALHPDETVQVSSEEPGRLSAVHVDFGQRVRQGQVIAELDKRELQLQVDRSKAALAQALARLGLSPEDENARPETTPAIRQANAQLEDARSKYDNAQRLVKSGDISQERFTEIEKAYQVREAALQGAKDETRTLLASVQALRTEVQMAQKRLGDLTVRAPFDGEVSERLASPGQYLRENAPIVTLVKTSPMRLRVEVPETAAGAIRAGSTLLFTTDAAPGVQFPATIRELNPAVDQKNRTLVAEARLSQGDPRLRPGMFVQVLLVLSKNSESVFVPKDAVYNVAGLTKLFVIQNGKAVERRITTGQEMDGWIEVPRDQVNPGDQVATSALAQLIPGAPVKATPKG
ncbi:MAG TPA: efflux RND transporter periplasmic adaptor subunit [Bryobacteraceae bacterium]|nr:efflux RND transporter periplasmic adaptor subunit [Bryobacteraceae bacterium]